MKPDALLATLTYCTIMRSCSEEKLGACITSWKAVDATPRQVWVLDSGDERLDSCTSTIVRYLFGVW